MDPTSRPHAFTIERGVFDRFPGLQVGVVLAFDIDNRGEREETLDLLRLEEVRVVSDLAGTLPAEHPQIAPWREAYRAFGANPKKYPSSIENLVGRLLRGGRVRHINLLVDIYNIASLRYLVPVGGEDLDRMDGDIRLTVASSDEAAIILLGEDEARAPQPGEVIYKDSIGAICRRFNWKEAERTKLTEETHNAILVIEALPPVETAKLRQAIDDLATMLGQWCGGRTKSALLQAESPQVEISY